MKKTFFKNHITHDDYKRCVLGSELEDIKQVATFHNFKTLNHQIGTYEITKFSLTNYCNKRHILNDGISSLAYGHKDILKISKQ